MDPNRLQKNVATLRHKAHSSFKSQTAWKQFWHVIPKPPSPQRGESIPNSADEWLESLKRPTRYICHQVLQALADEYKVSIVIFEMKDRWKPLTTIGTGKKVIPMMLRAQHFYTLQLKEGEKIFPHEWKKRATETTWMVGLEASFHELKTRRSPHSDRCQQPSPRRPYERQHLQYGRPHSRIGRREKRKHHAVRGKQLQNRLRSYELRPPQQRKNVEQDQQNRVAKETIKHKLPIRRCEPRIQQKGELGVKTRKADSPNFARHAQ